MRKLLLILLLLFPVHGACAEELRGMFGYDFGISESDISKENILPATREQELIEWATNPSGGNYFNVKKPIIKNKSFDVYTLYFTPISKKLYKIIALSSKTFVLSTDCQDRMRSVENILLKKYNSLSEFTEEKKLKKMKKFLSDEQIKEMLKREKHPLIKENLQYHINLTNKNNSVHLNCIKGTLLRISISNYELSRINRREEKLKKSKY